jgi:hypothetical protein
LNPVHTLLPYIPKIHCRWFHMSQIMFEPSM